MEPFECFAMTFKTMTLCLDMVATVTHVATNQGRIT